GVIADEPDRSSEGFSLGPTVIVSPEASAASGSVQPGSMIRAKYRVRSPAGGAAVDPQASADAFTARFPVVGFEARTRDKASPGSDRFVGRMGQFSVSVASAIYLQDRGPVFFVQTRVGRSNRSFHISKFRSMHVASSDAKGTLSASRNDNRVTPFGRFIRATSIDEMPQLINVSKGDMSIVGPRPHASGSRAENSSFWHIDERYWHRHAIKPGLTGSTQVRGYRGATERKADLVNRLQSDLEYSHNWTLWRDISISIRTVSVVLHQNAY
ncbi:hypothetical protein OY671_008206, partial [Metschnikowia pulcherrima]